VSELWPLLVMVVGATAFVTLAGLILLGRRRSRRSRRGYVDLVGRRT
jgi:hypothetical protein